MNTKSLKIHDCYSIAIYIDIVFPTKSKGLAGNPKLLLVSIQTAK